MLLCRLWLVLLPFTLMGCERTPTAPAALAVAESFIDSFYSWDSARLASLLLPGADADAVLYYQAWAEAAHYAVQERTPCRAEEDRTLVCAIKVTDDFGKALGYTATDTFTLTVGSGKVSAVSFAGDDPPVFQALFEWLSHTRPEVLAGPCRDMFAGGTTPADCARAVAQAARDFALIQAGEG